MVVRHIRKEEALPLALRRTRASLRDVQRPSGTERAGTMQEVADLGGTVGAIGDRQEEQDAEIADAQETADNAASAADTARSEADAAHSAARVADGKALVAQALAEETSDRVTEQQSVFRVTETGAEVASVDGSNLVQITPTGVAIVQGGTAASIWDAGRLIVGEAIVARAQIGNHVAERAGARTIWRPL